MPGSFHFFEFKFSEVKPSDKDLGDFLQLDLLESDHPALSFLDEILPSLDTLGHIHGGFEVFKVVEQNIKCGTIKLKSVKEESTETFEVGSQVCGYLKDSEYAALFLCTAGEEFNSLINHFNDNGDLLEAYLVDAIGSLTVENAMDRIMDILEQRSKLNGLKISNRYSPGYCNWHLAEQQKLFKMLHQQRTDIQLTESSLMFPTKSVSGIIGLGSLTRKRDYGCATCNNQTCIYRKILHQNE